MLDYLSEGRLVRGEWFGGGWWLRGVMLVIGVGFPLDHRLPLTLSSTHFRSSTIIYFCLQKLTPYIIQGRIGSKRIILD